MEQFLEKIDRLIAEYESLLPMSDEKTKELDKKIRLEFNFNSNHIEGNTLTYSETELLLIFDDTRGGHTMREYEEMKAHDVAFHLVKQWAEDPRPIVEADIKNLNKILLVRPYWKEAITPDGQPTRRQIQVGEYKKYPNSVQLANGEIFEYATPEETPILMEELMDWYHSEIEKGEVHPLLLAALMHYKFVKIHPFDDGNGRVSRLLMNYVFLYHGFPPVIIKTADKANYLRALNIADTGDTEPFVRYIGEQLIWSLELHIKAAKGESLEELGDLDKELTVLQKQLGAKNKLEEKSSPYNISVVIEKNLTPLFQLVESKLQIVAPYFFKTERRISPNTQDSTTTLMITQEAKDWQNLIDWVHDEIVRKNKRIKAISYTYDLEGLKSTVKTPSFQAYIPVTFDEFNYKILDKPYPYGQVLSNEQMQEIINPVIKKIIESIKAAIAQG